LVAHIIGFNINLLISIRAGKLPFSLQPGYPIVLYADKGYQSVTARVISVTIEQIRAIIEGARERDWAFLQEVAELGGTLKLQCEGNG
tara:strand:- start:603 stop:866 length:264 start_codon:yes stop_codon:yes gene_type:complete